MTVQKGLEAFLRSEAGKDWAVELAAVTSDRLQEAIVQRTTSLAGAAARHAQSRLEELIEGTIQFDNPIVDGFWRMVPMEHKRQLYNRLARALRKGGLQLVPTGQLDTEGREVDDDNGAEGPQLAAGTDSAWQHQDSWNAPP